MQPTKLTAICGALLLVEGCAGLSQLQSSMSKFDQGAHQVATSEAAFYANVRTADCTYQNYESIIDSVKQKAPVNLGTSACKPTILTDDEIATRQLLMDAITLYADKIQALATDDSNKSLSDDSQKLAKDLNSEIKGSGVATEVETAVVAISEMALDQRRFKDIKDASSSMEPTLEVVVGALKAENTSFIAGLSSKTDGTEIALRTILADEAKHHTLTSSDVIAAQQVISAMRALGYVPSTPSANDESTTGKPRSAGTGAQRGATIDPAAKLNEALDSLVAANKAIATVGTGGIEASVNDLVARAEAAQAFQAALTK